MESKIQTQKYGFLKAFVPFWDFAYNLPVKIVLSS